MKSVPRAILMLALGASIAFLLEGLVTPLAFAAATTPNKVEIVRTPGVNTTSHSSQVVVLRVRLVQELYEHILSLPTAPADQLCPMYLIATYQLTFFSNDAPVLSVNAVDGQCQPVTLGSGDVRAGDATFWKLLNQAQAVGRELSAGRGLCINRAEMWLKANYAVKAICRSCNEWKKSTGFMKSEKPLFFVLHCRPRLLSPKVFEEGGYIP
jgi:hypothetical protein